MSMTGERIRPATGEDIEALADLLVLLFTQEADFQPDRQKQLQGLRLILETPGSGRILVSEVDGLVVGMVSLLFSISTAQGGPVCWLEDMIVHPAHRGNGAGSRLLQSAIDDARTAGFSRITLLTDAVNESAIRFYERHGFARSAMTTLRLYLE